jgi:hypothetical protein
MTDNRPYFDTETGRIVPASTAVAVRAQQSVVLTNDQLQYIAHTEFVPKGLRGNLPAILACVATGRALGIPDMTALRSIHLLDGRPTFSAELMVMLVRQRGHSIQGEVDEGACTVVGKRADNGDEMKVRWTLAMAQRAGLANKSNWTKYPEAMLWARAVSQLCRELFADVFAGSTYTPEELSEDEIGARVEGLAAPTDGDAGAPVGAPSAGEAPIAQPPADPAEGVLCDGQPEQQREQDTRPATAAQKKKLDILVSRLAEKADDAQQFKRRLWLTIALHRVRQVDDLILELDGIREDGKLHWSPLRASLTRSEAHLLIDKLESLEA